MSTKLLQPATNQMAYLKAGLLGFPGSGKTYTASLLAIGLAQHLNSKKPVAFFDTETGSDYVIPLFRKADVPLLVTKRRSFSDLCNVVNEAEAECSVLIVDSVSHVWAELVQAYLKKKNQDRLYIQDFGILKPQWGKFTDLYLNSRLHIIICGRAAWDYESERNEKGKLEFNKTGNIHMRTESEFGYEPSLLIEMEAVKETRLDEGNRRKKPSNIVHQAFVVKDRTDLLNGQTFNEPNYKTFEPVIKALNIGGEHMAVDTEHTSEGIFNSEGRPDWQKEQKLKEIKLDEIQSEISAFIPGQSNLDKAIKGEVLFTVFKTRSWAVVQEAHLEVLAKGLDNVMKLVRDEKQMKNIRELVEARKGTEKKGDK